jgi:hypothetical protein
MNNNLTKNIFNAIMIAQFFCAMLFIDHRFNEPLKSDIMFGVLIALICMSIYMFWQIFTSKILVKSHKIVGTIMGSLPIVWLLSFLNYIS